MEGYKMIMERFRISNPMGLDVHCVRRLIQTTLQFESAVVVKFHDKLVDGKSLGDVLGLGIPYGVEVGVSVHGCDAPQAFQAIEYLFTHAFSYEYKEMLENCCASVGQ